MKCRISDKSDLPTCYPDTVSDMVPGTTFYDSYGILYLRTDMQTSALVLCVRVTDGFSCMFNRADLVCAREFDAVEVEYK